MRLQGLLFFEVEHGLGAVFLSRDMEKSSEVLLAIIYSWTIVIRGGHRVRDEAAQSIKVLVRRSTDSTPSLDNRIAQVRVVFGCHIAGLSVLEEAID